MKWSFRLIDHPLRILRFGDCGSRLLGPSVLRLSWRTPCLWWKGFGHARGGTGESSTFSDAGIRSSQEHTWICARAPSDPRLCTCNYLWRTHRTWWQGHRYTWGCGSEGCSSRCSRPGNCKIINIISHFFNLYFPSCSIQCERKINKQSIRFGARVRVLMIRLSINLEIDLFVNYWCFTLNFRYYYFSNKHKVDAVL